MKYRQLNGSENRLSFGAYPDVSLAHARDRRGEARKLLAENIDPGTVRDAHARAAKKTAGDTFEKVARLWHATMIETWQPQTARNVLQRFEMDIFPVIGKDPIAQVKRDKLLAAVRGIEKRGAKEVARRLTSDCSRVFNFAIDSGLATLNPALRLVNVLLPKEGRALSCDRFGFAAGIFACVVCERGLHGCRYQAGHAANVADVRSY